MPEQAPSDFQTGQLSRTDVLLALGEPDGRGPDDSWFVYASTRTWKLGGFLIAGAYGGVGVLGGMGVHQSELRLLVTFDPAGRVSDARIERRACSRYFFLPGGFGTDSSDYCADPTGKDIPGVRQAASELFEAEHPEDGKVVGRYDTVAVMLDPTCHFLRHLRSLRRGTVFITSRALVQPSGVIDQRGTSPETMHLRFDEIEQVLPVKHWGRTGYFALRRRDHACLFVTVPNPGQVREVILEQIPALRDDST